MHKLVSLHDIGDTNFALHSLYKGNYQTIKMARNTDEKMRNIFL